MEKTNPQLVPFFDRLFVQRDETLERTPSGVIIPDSDKEKPNRGIVILTGPDCKSAYPGQLIIFGQHNGFEIMVGTEEYTILREQDIYAGEEKDKPLIVTVRDIDQAKGMGTSPLEESNKRINGN